MNKDKLLCRSLAVYVSDDSVTKKKIFKVYHDDLLSNHFARVQTENVIRKKYFWLSILFKIEEYIRTYFNCQRVPVHHHKLYNKFNFILSSDENSFYTMIMNFITNISSMRNLYINKTCDAILMLMNKLTKHAIYIAIIKKLNAKNFAKLLWREFISYYNMMRNIISNRSSLFMNHFWSTLCWHLNCETSV